MATGLIGFPALIAVITTGFASLMGWLVQFVTRKLAIRVLLVAFFAGLAAALAGGLNALASTLAPSIPAEFLGHIGLFLPSGYDIFIPMILAAHFLRWAFDWKTKLATLYAS